jgi:hypothetical protein
MLANINNINNFQQQKKIRKKLWSTEVIRE